MTFLEAPFLDSSTNDTFSCSNFFNKIPQCARPDNTRHIAIKPFSRLLLNYCKTYDKTAFFCNTMLSVLASFLAHCLSIYGQLSEVVFEVGTFFIHEYTNAMRILQKHVSTNYAQYFLAKPHMPSCQLNKKYYIYAF